MLSQILQHFGVRDYSQLSAAEKKTYDQWAKVLNSPDPTLFDVRAFLSKENQRAHAELEKYENSKDQQIFHAALAHLTSTLSKFLAGPGEQRETLKATLKQTFNIDI